MGLGTWPVQHAIRVRQNRALIGRRGIAGDNIYFVIIVQYGLIDVIK